MTGKKKTIEETYQKLTQLEHILKRPGMYIGSTRRTVEELWVFDNVQKRMVKKMVEYTPGFLKIFDEVLTNALDHSNRDSTLDKIKLDYNTDTGEIRIWNNGNGIPIVEHKDHNMYVPELIFGHMLSGSNYDDNEMRTGAGTNGLGIKLANIYSSKFCIETIDSERNLKFTQTYTNNMSQRTKPKITKSNGKSYTLVSFVPDYERFGMKCLDKDTISLLDKRIYDCIACTHPHVTVFVNGEKIKGKGLLDYVKYFFEESKTSIISERNEQKIQGVGYNVVWEYVIVPWDQFEQVSFVNGNSTYQGGKHVDYVMYQIVNKLKSLLESKKKLKDVRPAMIKERMFLFLRATIVNPQFSSQTKEQLTTQSKDFGCKTEVSDKFIDKLWKSCIIEDIVQVYKMKESVELARKTDGVKKSKIYIPKLEDALWAGTAKSNHCTLILTEGDSAKTFALWGRSVLDKGIDKYGIFPLRGKCLNVRDATAQQLINNEEINNLKQIIGLKQNIEYTNTSNLRYGKVMILTDADTDGSHIKGLLVNFIHAYWPSLIKLNFVQTIRTPIIKAVKGKSVIEFYTEQDYTLWRNSGINASSFHIRYFKGLGTSTKEDAKDTFKRIENLRVDYYYKDSKCDESILLAFEKDKNIKLKGESENELAVKCTDKRKLWLSNYNRDLYISSGQNRVSFQELIHKELIHFSIYDNLRSIPSMCDGLKPSQRKILYYMLQKNITKSIKVAQLSGYVSAETSYHHGEVSLQQAIIGMAQDFVGTNNINLLYPDGNFGSRLQCKDAASPRYIFTHLSAVTPLLFHKDDAPLLNMLDDDGQQVEPEWFLPILPMVLVNGCEGIGTGYSTFIPPHNPVDIIANIQAILANQPPREMQPFYKNFNGEITEVEPGSYVSRGRWKRITDTQIQITELPVGTWVTSYKEFLESLIEGASRKDEPKKRKMISLKDVQNKTLDENTGIDFIVEFKSSEELDKLVHSNLVEKELKLLKSFNTNNMFLFDDNLVPSKYKSTLDILLDYCDIRLEFYVKRRQYMINKLQQELEILTSKVRFIEEYIDGKIDINRKTREQIYKVLATNGYKESEGSFDYLVRMQLISLSREKIDELLKVKGDKETQLSNLLAKNEKDLWNDDLQHIKAHL